MATERCLRITPTSLSIRSSSVLWRRFSAAAPTAVALVAWLVVLWRVTGDPKAILTAEANWGVGPSLPFEAFTDLFDPKVYGFPYFVLGFTLFIGALVLFSWRLLRPSLAAYATVVFLISVATGSLTSSPRYYLSAFTSFIFLPLGALLRPSL